MPGEAVEAPNSVAGPAADDEGEGQEEAEEEFAEEDVPIEAEEAKAVEGDMPVVEKKEAENVD